MTLEIKHVVQRWDGPIVGWFTIAGPFDTRVEALMALVKIEKTPGAGYCTCTKSKWVKA